MNAEETQIYEFLKKKEGAFVSTTDISKFLDAGRRFQQDRNWARPVLRRMEMDGLIEANPYGEYRVKPQEPEAPAPAEAEADPADFKEALRMPGASLADTTIIRIQDV